MPASNEPSHVVFGAGPLGFAVARELSRLKRPVRLVSRSGKPRQPLDAGITMESADVTDAARCREVCQGAQAVYHCIGLPYPRWREFPALMNGIIEGAASAGARIVYGDNVYSYGAVSGPMREGLPETATTVKGRIRAEVAGALMDSHRAGKVSAVIGRASDFFGPGVTDASMLGSRVFERLLERKAAQVVGNPSRLHSYTYLPDFALALIALADRDEAAGSIWHVPNAPAVSTKELIRQIAAICEVPPRLSAAPSWVVSLLGTFDPQLRELREMLYEFDSDFVVDSSRFEAAFGIQATPFERSLRETVTWWKSHRPART